MGLQNKKNCNLENRIRHLFSKCEKKVNAKTILFYFLIIGLGLKI